MKGLMSRRDCGAGVLVFAAAFLFGNAKAAVPEATVSIDNFTFKPNVLTIKPGTIVTFVNHDSTAHTATSKQQGAFDTSPIQPGKSASLTLEEPGTFVYYCVFHPFMKGTIKVE